MRFETMAIHSGQDPDPVYGAVIPPLYLSSTYAYRGPGRPGPFDYSRSGNPTRKALEDCLAALEGGHRGFAFATGMAAEETVLSLLDGGDHILVHNDLYGGTYRILDRVVVRRGVDVQFIDLRDGAALEGALRPQTRMIWAETPTNPLINLLDLSAIAAIARPRGILTVCDNTFLSPFFQKPLEHGIDIAIHSSTKYLNGHSDVVGGAVVVKDPDVATRIEFLQNALGTGQSPHDAFLVLRGIKTLSVRMREHERNSLAVARFLEDHPKVLRVIHPGLESHPQRDLARRQTTGAGGTFSFRLRGGRAAVDRLLGEVKLFILAESLGGVESLIEHPWTMTHASMPEDVRVRVGITEDLVRVSVGIENSEDLVEDLRRALEAA